MAAHNERRHPAELARSCGSMPHWGIDRCATPQRRPLHPFFCKQSTNKVAPTQSLPCVKGDSPQCGEMSRSDKGARRVSGCPAGAEGLWPYGGRSIFGQGHNPPPPIGGAPFTQGGLWVVRMGRRCGVLWRGQDPSLQHQWARGRRGAQCAPVRFGGGAGSLRASNARPYGHRTLAPLEGSSRDSG